MAWVTVDLDDTLIEKEPTTGQVFPTDGAVEAMQTFASQGHRLTVFTDRFAPMPAARRQELKEQIEQELLSLGFPQMEIWTGTTKPAADIFIGAKSVTFDRDWGLVLAQTQQMMEDRGLIAPPLPFDVAEGDPNNPTLADPGMDPELGNPPEL